MAILLPGPALVHKQQLCLQNISCALMRFVRAKLTAHKATVHVSARYSTDTLASFAGAISSPDAVVSKLTCFSSIIQGIPISLLFR